MSFMLNPSVVEYFEDYEDGNGPFTPGDGTDPEGDGHSFDPINGSWSGHAERSFNVGGASNTDTFGSNNPHDADRLRLKIYFDGVDDTGDYAAYRFRTANNNVVGEVRHLGGTGLQWRTGSNSFVDLSASVPTGASTASEFEFDINYPKNEVKVKVDGVDQGTFNTYQDVSGDSQLNEHTISLKNDQGDTDLVATVVDDITIISF
jgi:hypothetical protein